MGIHISDYVESLIDASRGLTCHFAREKVLFPHLTDMVAGAGCAEPGKDAANAMRLLMGFPVAPGG